MAKPMPSTRSATAPSTTAATRPTPSPASADIRRLHPAWLTRIVVTYMPPVTNRPWPKDMMPLCPNSRS